MMIFNAYRENEAAGDLSYLNKGIQSKLDVEGVSKDANGYYAWKSVFGTANLGKFTHVKCYFRKDQLANLAEIKGKVAVRGICAGVKGRVPTRIAGVIKDYPCVVFVECEVVRDQ